MKAGEAVGPIFLSLAKINSPMNLVQELRWRGLIHDMTPGTEERLEKGMVTGYIGFDPTADSLHIGSLVPIMLLVHLQRAGHKPIALVGGATGMVGDPSGKSEERNLLNEEVLRHNQACVYSQLERFLNFDCGANSAEMVNNYDWFKDMHLLDFIRDVGKHITVNYMMAKESVKKRIETGISFAEFSYQMIQGYDYYWLFKNKNCELQMGGSDQWGNITTGTEFIRKMDGAHAFALTAPLVTKADGSKFGKTEDGNIWLDAARTSPYKFYQFWLNVSDEDAARYIRIFTLLDEAAVLAIEEEHKLAPNERALQRALAKDITIRIHGEEHYVAAVEASEILFGKSTAEGLKAISEEYLLAVFEGVPQASVSLAEIAAGIQVVDLFSDKTGFLKSKSEVIRALKENSIAVNKEKSAADQIYTSQDLIGGKYMVLQRGKRNYFLLKAE